MQLKNSTPSPLPFRGGGLRASIRIAIYADWTFSTPGRASQVRQIEG